MVTIVSEQTRQDETLTSASPRPDQLLPISALLDNVRSTFNVGSIFRCADGAAVRHLYLCGITPTPAHPKLSKTALGAEASVGWSQHNNALDLAQRLKAEGNALWALENQPDAESPLAIEPTVAAPRVILVVGNEVAGIDPALLALCARTIAIPMYGAKRSLNVAIAFGIAVYGLRFTYYPSPSFASALTIE
jgi:tRNA G18 (ribose-2'-O)-methylase SpoU